METPKTRKRRGEPLVAKILEATLSELARVGYDNLSIEEVAARAGVNKTTIYRRWPTPEALAVSAFESGSDQGHLSDTGSLRGDLLDYLRRYREVCRSPAMLSMVRMHFSGASTSSTLAALIKERTEKGTCDSLVLFQRAVERGELPNGTDIELVRDLVLGSAEHLIIFRHERCSDKKIEQIVDLMLLGATTGGGVHAKVAPKKAPAVRLRGRRVIAPR
jgi:AcrR family transcriptional regulator